MGSEGRRGPSRLRKRGEGVTSGAHGVRDRVPDEAIPRQTHTVIYVKPLRGLGRGKGRGKGGAGRPAPA